MDIKNIDDKIQTIYKNESVDYIYYLFIWHIVHEKALLLLTWLSTLCIKVHNLWAIPRMLTLWNDWKLSTSAVYEERNHEEMLPCWL